MIKKQEQLELTEILRKDFKKEATDISTSLNDLQSILDSSIKSILTKMQQKIANKQFDIDEYTKSVSLIENVKSDIYNLDFLLNCNDDEKNNWKINNLQALPAFKVDSTIEHTLNENLQFKSPYGFSICKGSIIKTRGWVNLFYKVCEHFIVIDERLFLTFENKQNMNGRKTKYFSKNPYDLKNPISIKDKIFIKTIKDTDIIKRLIINILDEYNYSIDDFILYFDSDFTDLNR